MLLSSENIEKQTQWWPRCLTHWIWWSLEKAGGAAFTLANATSGCLTSRSMMLLSNFTTIIFYKMNSIGWRGNKFLMRGALFCSYEKERISGHFCRLDWNTTLRFAVWYLPLLSTTWGLHSEKHTSGGEPLHPKQPPTPTTAIHVRPSWMHIAWMNDAGHGKWVMDRMTIARSLQSFRWVGAEIKTAVQQSGAVANVQIMVEWSRCWVSLGKHYWSQHNILSIKKCCLFTIHKNYEANIWGRFKEIFECLRISKSFWAWTLTIFLST